MLKFETTTKFDRDVKRARKRRLDLSLMKAVIDTLVAEKPLEPKHHDHELSGEYTGLRECHVLSDWLLIYRISEDGLTLVATRTGTHSDLF